MSIIIAFLTLFLVSADDVETFRATAPSYLTTETARDHLVAARMAAVYHRVDADLLLSIAWFESRYTIDAVGPMVRGKRACGVLQPIMEQRCSETPSLMGGYFEGAKHLREWMNAARGDMRTAMLGYAGGYALIKACDEGPLMVQRGGREVDLCTVVNARFSRMRWIQRMRAKKTAV